MPMCHPKRVRLEPIALLALPLLLGALVYGAPAARADAAAPATGCSPEIDFDPASPGFLSGDSTQAGKDQAAADCYAWQMFVALNWPVDPAWPGTVARAGEPDRYADVIHWGVPEAPNRPLSRPAVWQSFKPAADIFKPKAASPSEWGVVAAMPAKCKSAQKLDLPGPRLGRVLRFQSKLPVDQATGRYRATGTLVEQSSSVRQAAGGWLTDQQGKLVWYDILVSRAEFEYINDEGLYDAANQHKVANNADGDHPEGLSLPRGVPPAPDAGGPQRWPQLGAFEVKAAWRVLTGRDELYPRYLTSIAWLQDPDTGACTEEVVGLVGLHIIHASKTFPDFIWATFEQVDNVPGNQGETPPAAGYSFNNPECDGPHCEPNQARLRCDAKGECKALYPRHEPVQVTRVHPTPKALDDLNAKVVALIASQTASRSVFQYYKLVNVLWDPSPSESDPGPAAAVPLHFGGFASQGDLPVANTTLETYAQASTCTDCHASATIAGSKTLASDFSFLFGTADTAQQDSPLAEALHGQQATSSRQPEAHR